MGGYYVRHHCGCWRHNHKENRLNYLTSGNLHFSRPTDIKEDKWIQHIVCEIILGADEENKARKGKIHVRGDENDCNFRKDTQGKSHRNDF